MLVLFALACFGGPPPVDPAAYAAALAAVAADPAAGAEQCRALTTDAERTDCLSAAAEGLARAEPAAAATLCAELPDGLWRDECGFQVAEVAGDPARCAAAGRFAEDCRMHLWSRAVARALPAAPSPTQAAEPIARLALDFGFDAADPRPWVAAWRIVGAQMDPLDRAACDALPAERADGCRATLRDLYADRLNHARDTRRFPCDGQPLTGRLAYAAPDPELDALVASRREADLCP